MFKKYCYIAVKCGSHVYGVSVDTGCMFDALNLVNGRLEKKGTILYFARISKKQYLLHKELSEVADGN